MQEKKIQDILRRELGHFYTEQSFEELGQSNHLCGLYVRTCHEEKIELKSDLLMELQIIESMIDFEKDNKKPYTGDPYEVLKSDGYTGFTSTYVSIAIMLNVDLIPTIINDLIEADEKHGTSIETILSRDSTCLMSIDGGEFLNKLLAKCSNEFIELWKVWFDNYNPHGLWLVSLWSIGYGP